MTLRSDGLDIHAVLNCRGKVTGRPAAVLLHGFHSCCQEFAGLAVHLAEHEFAVLRMDLRGNGLSDGNSDDINGYVGDASAGLEYLVSAGVDKARIYLVGQSLGAAVAITCGVVDSRAAGVVAMHPSSVYDLGAYNAASGHPDVRKPSECVGKLSPRPLLIIAGEKDHVLPCSSAEDLYAAARQPKRMIRVKDGRHELEDAEAYALGWLLAGAPTT